MITRPLFRCFQTCTVLPRFHLATRACDFIVTGSLGVLDKHIEGSTKPAQSLPLPIEGIDHHGQLARLRRRQMVKHEGPFETLEDALCAGSILPGHPHGFDRVPPLARMRCDHQIMHLEIFCPKFRLICQTLLK
ncbi:hypothetical protein DYI26_14975 [Halomonas litopenaei]|nr:hypothetical protein [Halomonas litopenaei]